MGTGPVRAPAVAGAFYASGLEALSKQVRDCFEGRLGPGAVPRVRPGPLTSLVGVVSPHAGLQYSGYAAAHSFAALAQDGTPDALVLVGPNHHGYGQRMAVAAHGSWRTPLGEVEIDQDLARELLSLCPALADDTIAHRAEHSLEVQLPFIQFLYGNAVRIVPITLYTFDFDDMHRLGQAIAKALAGKNAAIVASTDMTHYEAEQVAKVKDSAALNAILNLDERQLVAAVRELSVTMCGLGPVVTTLVAAKRLGATRGVLNAYYSSGAITGDHDEVVGYASVSLLR